MITLYHCVSARSFRPLWMLEELGIRYTLRMLPFPPRALAPHYLKANPLGTVPMLLDGDTRMTESAAICQYLAARYGSAEVDVPSTDAAFGNYLNWLHFGEATLTFPQTLVLRYARFEPEGRRLPQIVDDYSRWFMARLRGVEAALSVGEFICGGRFTAADVSVGYALMLAAHLALDVRFPKSVGDYWIRLQGREAFQRALLVQERAARDQGVPVIAAPEAGQHGSQ